MEWERQRKEHLLSEKHREYEQLETLKSQSTNLKCELEALVSSYFLIIYCLNFDFVQLFIDQFIYLFIYFYLFFYLFFSRKEKKLS